MKRWVAVGTLILLINILVFSFCNVAFAYDNRFTEIYNYYVNQFGDSPTIVIIASTGLGYNYQFILAKNISFSGDNFIYENMLYGYFAKNGGNVVYDTVGSGSFTYDRNWRTKYDDIVYVLESYVISNVTCEYNTKRGLISISRNSVGYMGGLLDDFILTRGSYIAIPKLDGYIFKLGVKYELKINAIIDNKYYTDNGYDTDRIYLFDSAGWSIKLIDSNKIDLLNGKYYINTKYEIIPTSYINTLIFKLKDNLLKVDYLEKKIEVRATESENIVEKGGIDTVSGLKVAPVVIDVNVTGNNNINESFSEPDSNNYSDDILGKIKYGFDTIIYYLKMPFKFIADSLKQLGQFMSEIKENVSNVSTVVAGVFEFLPAPLKGLMFASLVSAFIIVVYKALRG